MGLRRTAARGASVPAPPPALAPGMGRGGDDRRRDLARRGFARGADRYERGRPGYPVGLVDLLRRYAGLGPDSLVADVAAGTGKLSRQLLTVAPCVAVEPSAGMRAACRRHAPGVASAGGTAEAVPLATGACDLVTVAQAFHWFDPGRALPELARILRPGGALALVWNELDGAVPWVAELRRILHDAGHVHPAAVDYRPVLDGSPWFGPADHCTLPFTDTSCREELVDLAASRSYVNVLGPAERAAVLDRVAALARTLVEPITVPYRTEVLLARAVRG